MTWIISETRNGYILNIYMEEGHEEEVPETLVFTTKTSLLNYLVDSLPDVTTAV
jgi:hypothetical protein